MIDNSKNFIFQKALNDAQQVQNVPVELLENLTQQYPWFTQAHQLLAKKYQLNNNSKFNEQLQHAALLTINRIELFNLMESDFTIEKPKIITEPILPKTIIVEEKKQPEIVTKPIAIVENKVEKNTEKIIADIIEETPQPIAVNAVQPIEVELKTVASITETKEEKKTINTNSTINTTMSSSPETPKTFSTWLKKFNKGSNIGEPKPATIKSEMKSKIEAGYNDDDNEADDLKVDFSEISSFGMQQREEFVTETMAKIYVEQEKYDKAISIYEKLCLLKPEKSVFFASRIADLKNKI
jgi:hypothetical protein